MKKTFLLLPIIILSFGFLFLLSSKKSKNSVTKLPIYSHIVIVIEENKSYDQIIGNKAAPYINNVLKKEGANFTQMFAEEHFSEGNYFWLLSGSNQNVKFSDGIPDKITNPQYPFTSSNLAQQLIKKSYTFKGFSESLPSIGDTISLSGYYARKHVPWISFANMPNSKSAETSSNLQFNQFPSDFNKLPTVSIVIPNLIHDMHNGLPPQSITDGDAWLKNNLDKYYQWAKSHNSLLIITFDENDDQNHYSGATDPASKNHDIRNRIPTIIAGAHIIHGNYAEGKGISHVNILRTIEAIYSLPKSGFQQTNCLKYGITNDYIIEDIFSRVK
ncbi:MAG: alkaline phosphatase family protein [Ignavibacteriaceae bacterium]